jgi:hypothetical protein
MDGRTQLPVHKFLSRLLAVQYVDTITEPGPVGILANPTDAPALDSIHRRVQISLKKHHSQAIAVVAHADCAGNPVPDSQQHRELSLALAYLAKHYPGVRLIALWVDDGWQVHDLTAGLAPGPALRP